MFLIDPYHFEKTRPDLDAWQFELITNEIKITGNSSEQVHSYTYHREVDLQQVTGTRRYQFEVPIEYYYQLANVRVSYPAQDAENDSAPLTYRVYIVSDSKTLMDVPLRAELQNTPVNDGRYTYVAPLWYTMQPKQRWYVELSGMDGSSPARANIMCEGLLIPRDQTKKPQLVGA